MQRITMAAIVLAALACEKAHEAPRSPLTGQRAGGPVALFSNGGFEGGDLSNWTVESFLNANGVTYPSMNGTSVPPQTLADLNLGAGGVANSAAVGPGSAFALTPNGLSAATSLRYPVYGSYAAVVNGQKDVALLNGTYPYGANTNVNSIKQDMVVASTDVDPVDGLAHVRFLVAPVLQNPNHTTTQQPYYYLHVKNLTTGQELFNRFNYVAQAGVPWQTDANGAVEYLAWQAVDVAAAGLISVGDDVQAQVLASGCSLGGHWGEAYVDSFGAFLPGLTVVARQPQWANEGTDVSARYTVNNGSVTTHTNVKLTLPTPNNATFTSFTPPADMSCTGIPAAGGTGTITCTISSMAQFSAQSFTIVWHAKTGLTLPADLGNGSYGVQTDQQGFLLGMPATTYLTNPANITYADYSVAIDDGATAVGVGQPISYTVTVKNNGPGTPASTGKSPKLSAVPVAMTNSTGGLTGVTWTCAATGTGSGFTSACGAPTGTGLPNTTVALVSGGVATFTVKATTAAPASGSYLNATVSVTTSGLPTGYGDPDSGNNIVGDTDLIGTLLSVTVSKDTTAPYSTGLLSSAPAGLSCGTSCTTQAAQFVTGQQITVTAVPDTGNSFGSWTAGPCAGSTNPQCTFTPTANTSLTVKFFPPSYSISTSASGGGSIVCQTPVYQGASSLCTVSANSGYALTSLTDNGTSVTGSVVGTQYTISNVQAAHSVVAAFLKALGTGCGGAGECGSGQCVDGVCCNTVCDGQCNSCAMAGSVGTCSIVTGAPVDGRAACASDGSACGGSCDGTSATACTYPGSATACRAASCALGTQTSAALCNGTGLCPASGTAACNPYVCGAAACLTSCTADADCVSGDYCNGSQQCVPRTVQGGSCTSSAQCGTGNCVDGVCCNTACNGQCNSCALPGSAGVCSVVTGAPVNGRAACASDGSSCGGSCDGVNAAACAYPATQCRGASCSNGTATLSASCSGGSCPALQTQPCNAYVCGATACKTSCGADTDCVAGDYCNASQQCVPKTVQGGACTASAQCGTGQCVDGVCCNTACNGQCQACDVAGAVGTCSPVAGAPHQGRAVCASDGTSCGGSCDGINVTSCTYPSTQCRGASCASGVETFAASCSNGSCPAAQTQACGAYACGATACNGTCSGDTDCAAGDYCQSGRCVGQNPQGSACTTDNECGSGHCTDGVCCNTACNGQCQACDVQGSVGTCSNVSGSPHGTRTACATDGSLCGGTCDGTSATACAYPTLSCRDASCAANVATLSAACDGAGHCPAVQTQSCTPYTCGATACNGNCRADTDCSSGDWCSAGICTPKLADGSSCSAASQCASASCADGVCCNTACNGQCEACNVQGSAGTCTAVTGAPQDGRAACASDGSACGGRCDGTIRATCTYPGETTSCRDASCTNGTAVLAAGCNAAGACPAQQIQSCGQYVCGATACKGNCAVDGDCVGGDYCAAGVCTPKIVNGGACSAKAQCASGECVDGTCCNVACDGQCEACDVPGSAGTCTPVAGAPHGVRASCATDGSSCGGACDGTNPAACTYPVDQCRAGSCSAGVATLSAACDGAGHCPSIQSQACAPYACSGAACAGNCTSNVDCASGDYCAAGVCAPVLAQGGQCSADSQCGTGHCVDGVCCDTACNGQCEACNAAGSAGTCSPAVGAPRGGRPSCATDGSACGGACDGLERTACAYPVSQCRAASDCTSGVKTDAASCDGSGHCPARVQESCQSPQSGCSNDTDCPGGQTCSSGVCKGRVQWIVAGAGGCTSTGAATWPLLLLVAAFALRRRKLSLPARASGMLPALARRRKLAPFAAVLALAGAARAQSTAFTVDRFQPGAGAFDLLGVSSPQTAGDLDWHLSAYADYARDPLRLIAVGAPDQVNLLRSQSMLHLGGSVGFGENFEIGAVLPIALQQGAGAAPQIGISEIGSAGFGDVRLLPKLRLFSLGGLVVGAGLPLTLPTGRTSAFLGSGSFSATPTAMVELREGLPVRLVADAGVILRPGQKLTNLDVGTAVAFGLGGELPLPRRLALLMSLQGESNFGAGGTVERPMELMAALRWTAVPGFDLLAGGGPGLTNGYGTPRYRMFFSMSFTPGVMPARKVVAPPLAPQPAMVLPSLVMIETPQKPELSESLLVDAPDVDVPAQPELAQLDDTTGKIDLWAPVQFKNDSDVLLPVSCGVLDAAVYVLQRHPELARVRIEGHTDNKGKPAHNKELSQRRARAVMKYLIRHGVDAKRLDSAGFGDTRPVADNATDQGRTQNRRVELVIESKLAKL